MKDLSAELGIPIHRVMIRCQKTRWGSYSTKGTVSLNAQLLFLPRRLVRYILVHELCHAVHANHSAKFWDLVRQWEPKASDLRRDIRSAAQGIPRWLHSGTARAANHQQDGD
jgi:predicted metal-dependent hydrolase